MGDLEVAEITRRIPSTDHKSQASLPSEETSSSASSMSPEGVYQQYWIHRRSRNVQVHDGKLVLWKFRKRIFRGVLAIGHAILNVKLVAMGERADEGDHFLIARKRAPVQSQFVDRRGQRQNDLLDRSLLLRLQGGKRDAPQPQPNQTLPLRESPQNLQTIMRIHVRDRSIGPRSRD